MTSGVKSPLGPESSLPVSSTEQPMTPKQLAESKLPTIQKGGSEYAVQTTSPNGKMLASSLTKEQMLKKSSSDISKMILKGLADEIKKSPAGAKELKAAANTVAKEFKAKLKEEVKEKAKIDKIKSKYEDLQFKKEVIISQIRNKLNDKPKLQSEEFDFDIIRLFKKLKKLAPTEFKALLGEKLNVVNGKCNEFKNFPGNAKTNWNRLRANLEQAFPQTDPTNRSPSKPSKNE